MLFLSRCQDYKKYIIAINRLSMYNVNMASDIEYIVFHNSESDFGNVEIIRNWHLERGWRDIGYNGVITNGHIKHGSDYNYLDDGMFQEGRGVDLNNRVTSDERGAHVLSYNGKSLGFCLIGRYRFTIEQFRTAANTASLFKKICPSAEIKGHYEMSTARGKTCPNFNMHDFRELVKSNDFSDTNIKLIMSNNIIVPG
jgi:hypothetical protein